MFAIFARYLNSKHIVTTVDASMSIDEMGFIVTRTKVGDPYISEELKVNGEFGGEPSGAWVFPQISFCPDGIYAAAQIAAIASQQRLSELVDNIPSYPIIRGNISGETSTMQGLTQKLIAELNPLQFIDIDGAKLIFKDGWLLIRPSGTEPKIRITAEARDEIIVRNIYDNGVNIIMEHLQGHS